MRHKLEEEEMNVYLDSARLQMQQQQSRFANTIQMKRKNKKIVKQYLLVEVDVNVRHECYIT